jgi:hypothetical protein
MYVCRFETIASMIRFVSSHESQYKKPIAIKTKKNFGRYRKMVYYPGEKIRQLLRWGGGREKPTPRRSRRRCM